MGFIKTNWLNAVTADGPSTAEELPGHLRVTLQVSATGNPTGGQVNLEASLDGSTWDYLFASALLGGPGSTLVGPWKYYRLNLVGLTGGSSPTVSAHFMAVHADV